MENKNRKIQSSYQSNIKKGDIFYADLSGTVGSEQNGKRPVLIVQNDVGNKYSPTVIIVPLSTKTKKINQPTHYWLNPMENLKNKSLALTEQIRVIDKSRLEEKIATLKNDIIEEIDSKILVALGINHRY